MKKKTKIIIIIVSTFIVIWGTFFTTDFIRVKNEKAPIFCIRTLQYKDGGSTDYVGLFYWVKRQAGAFSDSAYSSTMNISLTYHIRPWFFPVNNIKTYLNTLNIDYISITDDNKSEIKITVLNDYQHISEYSYVGKWPEDKMHELFLFPNTRALKIYDKNGSVQSYYLLKSGRLVDSDKIRSYSTIYSFERLKVAALLEKYGGYVDKSNFNIGSDNFTIKDYMGKADDALQLIAEDENNEYYLSSIRSDKVTVIFDNGEELSLEFALENNIISIYDVINKGDISIITEPKGNLISSVFINNLKQLGHTFIETPMDKIDIFLQPFGKTVLTNFDGKGELENILILNNK